jgi:hypothetical protein
VNSDSSGALPVMQATAMAVMTCSNYPCEGDCHKSQCLLVDVSARANVNHAERILANEHKQNSVVADPCRSFSATTQRLRQLSTERAVGNLVESFSYSLLCLAVQAFEIVGRGTSKIDLERQGR